MLNKILKSIVMPKKIMLSSLILIVCTILIGFIAFVEIPSIGTLKNYTDFTGKQLGELVGTVIGSVEAISNIKDISEEAKADAADAEVIVEGIKKQFNSETVFEVLSADVKLKYVWKYGEPVSYAELFCLDAKGVFFVDLSQSDIEVKNNTVYVTVDKPSLEIQTSEEPVSLAKYEPLVPNIIDPQSGQSANEGLVDTRKKVMKDIKGNITDYDCLIEQAKNSAEDTIESLIKTVYKMDVVIDYKGEGKIYER